ncbi:hypothetical protein NXS19_002592 [Fusarium pseudograminearum]|uniref:Uncharacterized protein n=1 Tax=Fusarium pseudograminearum (strain CS3096) TaxID=1028729 RepID=K3VJS7_FUSPC|nr:hypothetical protein FPSE_05152 [Fusarium pseudograminearum CS3096]EKJ74684.1 hypothetical protein FPSE_05152 [Fusarium pseudograminearum CS3096]KAF0645361.1 hypothetical protein FPSE5266_05152 [Fusarium pseudograminearum]UZP34776.1 hypothetical protein NXS19_002592 [Fusarium pseudograminearum]
MPTKEVLDQWEAISPTAKGEGPLQGRTDPAQSLVSTHECFAARPNAEGCTHPCHDGRLEPDQDRVRNSGARTPNSIHADIVAQIEAKRERKESEAAENKRKQSEITNK